MKKEEWKKIFYQSLTMFMSLALAIVLFFVIWNFDQIRNSLYWVTGILTPFVYGGVLAYLLKTPCNFLQRRIEAILPDKKKSMANNLAVVLVIVLAGLVLYLLLIMVIPEVARSIAVLANTIPQSIEQLSAQG